MKSLVKFGKDFLRNEDGSVIVLISLMITFLLGIVALAIDYGVAIYHRTLLQASCDAAALAAANYLLDSSKSDDYVRKVAYDCFVLNMKDNGIDESQIGHGRFVENEEIEEDYPIERKADGTVSIKVNANIKSPTYFAKILGFSELNVGTTAKAATCSKKTRTIGDFAIFGKEGVACHGGSRWIEGAVGSGGDLNMGGPTEIYVSGGLVAGGKIDRTGGLDPYVNPDLDIDIDPDNDAYKGGLDFDDYCNNVHSYIMSDLVNTNIGSMTRRALSYGNKFITYTENWGGGDPLVVQSPWKRNGNVISLERDYYCFGTVSQGDVPKNWSDPNAPDTLLIDHNVYVDCNGGSFTLQDGGMWRHIIIKEGCTLYIKNASSVNFSVMGKDWSGAGNDGSMDIRGNLVIDNDPGFTCSTFAFTGGKVESSSSGSLSYIYCTAKSVTFGPACPCDLLNVSIVCPECDSFSWQGQSEGTTIQGTIFGKNLTSLGQTSMRFEYKDPQNPWVVTKKGVRLVE